MVNELGNQRQAAPLLSKVCASLVFMAIVSACSPTVKVEAPDKPIVINLNVKIEQEVRIRVEKEVEELFSSNPDIF